MIVLTLHGTVKVIVQLCLELHECGTHMSVKSESDYFFIMEQV